MKKEELIDFIRWLKRKGLIDVNIHGSIADSYLASINSESSSEAMTLSANEQTKVFFNCPICKNTIEVKEGVICGNCGTQFKKFTVEK